MRVDLLQVRKYIGYIVGAAQEYHSQYIADGQDEYYRRIDNKISFGHLVDPVTGEAPAMVIPPNAAEILRRTWEEIKEKTKNMTQEEIDALYHPDVESYELAADREKATASFNLFRELLTHSHRLFLIFVDQETELDFVSSLYGIGALAHSNTLTQSPWRELTENFTKDELKLLEAALNAAYLWNETARRRQGEEKSPFVTDDKAQLFRTRMNWNRALEKQALKLASQS